MKLLFWMPPSVATFVYTVVLKPKPLRLMAQRVIKKLIPPRLKVDGVEIVMNQNDAIVCGALTLGCYERFPLRLFRSLLKPGMAVVDVGANIGLYSALSADSIGPTGRVIAVEPEVHNCEFIAQTVALNRFTNVTICNGAVSNLTGPGHLFLNAENSADHRIFGGGGSKRVSVPINFYRLDDLLAEKSMAHVDVMKMDIQGAEQIAFEGMHGTLSANPDIRLMMEYWPWGILQAGGNPRQFLRTIRELGFHLFELEDNGIHLREAADDDALAANTLERQHFNFLLQRTLQLPTVPTQ